MNNRCIPILIVIFLIMATGCSMKRPTIAHTHIGHGLTGWHDTPDKAGLFVVAEKKARQSIDSAILSAQSANSLKQTKQYTAEVVKATNPSQSTTTDEITYGIKQALSGAVGHITYAATSDDATENVRQFASRFERYAQTVFDRCELIAAIGNDILKTKSRDESELLAGEVVQLTQANLYGEDADNDGQIGMIPTEYGLKQLRQKIEEMLDRENPPYATVNKWYLFNLIRLPDGSWFFRDPFEDDDDVYGGGGSDGGGGGY